LRKNPNYNKELMKSSSSLGFDSGITTMNPADGWQESGNHGFMAVGTGSRTSSVDVKFGLSFNSIPKWLLD